MLARSIVKQGACAPFATAAALYSTTLLTLVLSQLRGARRASSNFGGPLLSTLFAVKIGRPAWRDAVACLVSAGHREEAASSISIHARVIADAAHGLAAAPAGPSHGRHVGES